MAQGLMMKIVEILQGNVDTSSSGGSGSSFGNGNEIKFKIT